MGVSGSGKSTVGAELARVLCCPFRDGDDYHPASNIYKMENGVPLTDDDRWPWLEAIASDLREAHHAGQQVVIACSALKSAYRKRLASNSM